MTDELVRGSISDVIRLSGFSRDEIAERMTAFLGVDVSVSQLNSWTAESKGGYRFPLAYLPALCKATKSAAVLAAVAKGCGMYVISEEEYRVYELGQLEQQERMIQARKKLLRREIDHPEQPSLFE